MESKQYTLKFIHNDKEITLTTQINPLTNSWMWWYDCSSHMCSGNKLDLRTIIKNIRTKTVVLFDNVTIIK